MVILMDNAKEYYDVTKNGKLNKLLQEVMDDYLKVGFAIDLGCGAGRDTIYLLNKRI